MANTNYGPEENVFLHGANGTYQTSFGQLLIRQGRCYTKGKYVAELEALGFTVDGKNYANVEAPVNTTINPDPVEAEVKSDDAIVNPTEITLETPADEDEAPAEDNVATTQSFRTDPKRTKKV